MLKPLINTRNIKSQTKPIKRDIGRINLVSKNIKFSLIGKNKFKRESISRYKFFQSKREQQIKRKEREDILESSGISGAARRIQTVLSKSTRGFLGRVLDFTATLLVGWLVNNLPRIFKMAQELKKRISKMGTLLSEFTQNLVNTFYNFGQLLGSVYKNISSFDFFDTSGRVNQSLQDLQNNFLMMEQQFDEGIKMLTSSLEESKGGKQPSSPSEEDSSSTLPDSQSAEMYRIAAALSTEGSGKQSVVDMMQVLLNRKASGYGKTFTDILAAPGQFEGVSKRGYAGFRKIQSLKDASKWSGQSEASLQEIIKNIQDPGLQSKAASFVGGALEFRGSPATVRAVNSDGDPSNNIQADARGIIPGSVWRGGNGDNQFIVSNPPGTKPLPIRKQGPAPFNLPKSERPQTNLPANVPQFNPNKKYKPGDVLEKSINKGIEYAQIGDVIGASRGLGTRHSGLDIQCPSGTYIALKLDSEVVFAGWQNPNNHKEGYGQLIDLWVPQLSVQLRFAHCSGFLVTSGTIPAGKSFARVGSTGNSTGPHIHFEYSRTRNKTGYGSDGDPSPYVPYIMLTKESNSPPTSSSQQPKQTKVSSLSLKSPGSELASENPIPFKKNPELISKTNYSYDNVKPSRNGQKIIIVEDVQESPPPIVLKENSQSVPTIIVQNSLNSFIKQRLFLELAYT